MQTMIFAGEMTHFCYSFTVGKQSILKCNLSSVQLTLDDHILTAQRKREKWALLQNTLISFFSFYLDDPEHLSLLLFIHCRPLKSLIQ